VTADEELLRLPTGDRIRYVRREMLGVNQEAFAKRVGVSVRTVKRWEASFIAPTRDKAEKIAALANLASELFYPDESVEAEPIVEIREMLKTLGETITSLEETFTAVSERMVGTLAEMENQLAQQTSLLARQTALLELLEAKVAADQPKPRRARRQKS
jgi:transcriptional regulator with XRE-family HTH domain